MNAQAKVPFGPRDGSPVAQPRLPIFLDVQGLPCLVAADGALAEAKVTYLLRARASVRLFSPNPSPALRAMAERGEIDWHARRMEQGDLAAIRLVIAAPDAVPDIDLLRAACIGQGILLNVIDDPAPGDFAMPAVVERGPLTIAIATGGLGPAAAQKARQRIDQALPPAWVRIASLAVTLRDKVRAALPSLAARRRFWDAALADETIGRLAGLEDDHVVAALESQIGAAQAEGGSVTLVGAGPGGVEHLTLAGLRALQEADVILHDALPGDEILSVTRRDASRIPVGKRAGQPSVAQALINRMLADHAAQGLKVVRLKGGDPMVFGRATEEIAYLRDRNIPVRVVPGVTAALAAAAESQVSLTRRAVSRSVTFVTGHYRDGAPGREEWAKYASLLRSGQTLCLYMGRGGIGQIASALMAQGVSGDLPVLAVEKAGSPARRECRASLADLEPVLAAHLGAGPVVILLGTAIGEAEISLGATNLAAL